MKEVQDTLQVGIANSTAIVFSLSSANEILTLVSLTLAISYTIYKFVKFEEQQER
jgi:EamA domain-containing membrane protein RarD